ncbi:hypothetical protein HYH03_016843 [Edaphochlamys debaryana]|uniref:Prolyl 4-hydroxylase alpha subunit domain-containing protein n=1 Tax=Edaphochlamys debaryana TaxID=47281 RepID=A0A835XJG7_9CHLO|nr:hypothetical protein HYH03_016843 [Edaphochlamys debaryana]|eukprot:KAG2484297.1 hypothetical protein HYH03_016843 [Edaphochlamys debaryana]
MAQLVSLHSALGGPSARAGRASARAPGPACAPAAPCARAAWVRCRSAPADGAGSGAGAPTPAAPPGPSVAAAADPTADPAQLVGSAWDPEGLFARASGPLDFSSGQQMGDLILRREKERAAKRAAEAAAAAAASPAAAAAATAAPMARGKLPLPAGLPPVRPLPPGLAADPAAGVPVAELPADLVSELDAVLRERHMALDLSYPGLRVIHLDPPVVAVEGFFDHGDCDRMIKAGEASGQMKASLVGAGNVAAYGNAASVRRTSTGMMVTPGIAGPVMDEVVRQLHARGKKLLRAAEGPAWGSSGRLPRPGQYCYEALQFTRYETGQHFLAHEDGFPPHIAAANGFQRHATLLVYLNDVAEGGGTRFDHLGLAVRPQKGKLLLFFPGFADGRSDARSLHTAEDAAEGATKFVTQQWVARGLGAPAAAAGAGAAAAAGKGAVSAAAREEEARLEARERAAKAKGGKGGAKKGFGAGGKK